MLHLHHSNRLDALADGLAPWLGAGGPLDEDVVIVPSAGLRRWLTLRLARRDGVCAGLRFSFLAPWLWAQVGGLVPDVPKRSPLDPPVLAWRVYRALGDRALLDAHPRLAGYLGGADAPMRFELAQSLARTLDTYLTYRPDWLDAWSQQRPAPPPGPLPPDHDWQAALWRAVEAGLDQPARAPLRQFRQALDALAAQGPAAARAAGLPAAVHVFALPTMPPAQLALLQALARCIDVHLHALSPCREFWFDLVDARHLALLALRGRAAHHETGHPLLAGWGRQAQSQLTLLLEATDGPTQEHDHYIARADAAGPTDAPPPLLHRLQDALLDLAPFAPGSQPLAPDDRSIELHVAHSLTRELEVLHDRLLDLFARDPTLTPADVLVVMPRLDAAAARIDAVFGTVPASRRIPYAISGLASSAVNPVARTLVELLALLGGRLPLSGVLALLRQAPVAQRFGLDADDVALARQALMDAGAHWGLDAAHRATLGLPGDARHTLADALERLVLGHVMPTGAPPFDGRAPAGDLTGSDGRVLGALDALAQRLGAWATRLAVPHPAAHWPPLLAALLDDFARADADATEHARELHEALALLAQRLDTAGAQHEPLPLAVVRLALQQALDDPAHGGVAGGAVTFTSMSALRQVPMRVIAVLGLNDPGFPSPERPAEWDLMRHDPRTGDRQRRHDERNLFLDLLLAAGDVLHLSHTGRSQRDNAEMPPSVLASELLEHLREALAPGADGQRLTVQHPLQPFSDTLFDPAADPRLQSFHAEYAQALRARAAAPAVAAALPGADATSGDDAADDDDDETEDNALPAGPAAPFFPRPLAVHDAGAPLTLDDLTRFVAHPARTLLRERLRVELPWDEPLPEDDEPLVAEHPQCRALAQQVLPALLQGASRDTAVALARAATDWPTGPLGDAALAGALDDLQAFADRVAPLLTDAPRPPLSGTVTVPVDGTPAPLHIVLTGLRPGGRVAFRPGRVRPADLLAHWVSHLALCALAPPGVACRTVLVTDEATHTFTPVEAPLPMLGTLAALRRRGLAGPLPLLPKAAWALGEGIDDLAAARKAYQPTAHQRFTEGADAAWQLVLRGGPDPLADVPGGFVDLARAVFGPLRAALQVQPA